MEGEGKKEPSVQCLWQAVAGKAGRQCTRLGRKASVSNATRNVIREYMFPGSPKHSNTQEEETAGRIEEEKCWSMQQRPQAKEQVNERNGFPVILPLHPPPPFSRPVRGEKQKPGLSHRSRGCQ